MDMLEQDNYYDTIPTPFRFLLHHGLFEAKHVVSFMGWLDTPTLFSDLNAWIVVV